MISEIKPFLICLSKTLLHRPKIIKNYSYINPLRKGRFTNSYIASVQHRKSLETHQAPHSRKMPEEGKVLTSPISYRQPATENTSKLILDGLDKNKIETIIIDADSGRKWTGAEIRTSIIQLASFLIKECKLQKGDICSLYHAQDDQAALCILAITIAGGITNYLSDSNTGRELHDTASVLKSKILISDHDTLIKIQPNLADLEKNLCIVSMDEPVKKGFTNNCHTIGNILQRQLNEPATIDDKLSSRLKEVQPDDFAIIQFSSGTTGKPKPIPRTHKNLTHLVASVDHKEMMDLHPGIVITGSLPITHRPGLWALLASVHCGSTFVIWSRLSDVESALATVSKYKVTIFSSSLPFLSMLANTTDELVSKYDLTSWKHIITSGAKIVHDNVPKKLMAQLKLESIRQCFGMTESGWVFLIEKSLAKDRYLSVGHVCPGIEAKVIDRKTGVKLNANHKGEIALRGAQVFPGYLTDELGKLNRKDFDSDGWFRIGDQGFYDDNDLVFIEGRYSEAMILSNNYRVFPTEIEALIAEHPAVEGVSVVKIEVNKDFSYDIAKACITLKHGQKTTEKEVLDFLAERSKQVILSGGVEILDKFPRLGNGKVDRKTLAKSMKSI